VNFRNCAAPEFNYLYQWAVLQANPGNTWGEPGLQISGIEAPGIFKLSSPHAALEVPNV